MPLGRGAPSIVVAVPFYVGRPEGEAEPSDALFDHPTPLGGSPTLPRLLDSLRCIEGPPFRLVVVVASAAPQIAAAADGWARRILDDWTPPAGVEAVILGSEELAELDGRVCLGELLDPRTYSGVRNLCALAALDAGAKLLVLLDDDEEVTDGSYLDCLAAGLDRSGAKGMGGLYLEGGEQVVPPASPPPWGNGGYDPTSLRHAAFRRLLEGDAPCDAPFAFGGNLALSRDLLAELPFDPAAPRGEDVDYVLSARLLGHQILLDPRILVSHYPPPNSNPPWRQLRQDGVRFLTLRRKLLCARAAGCALATGAIDPYPGGVLTSDLGEQLAEAFSSLEAILVSEGKGKEADRARAAAREVRDVEADLEHRDPWREYMAAAKQWRIITAAVSR